MVSASRFWAEQNGVRHITPQGKPNPEGAWLGAYLERVGSHGFVVEFGCGPGRLACSFNPDEYLGLDINPLSISTAKERNRAHSFELVTDTLPKADAYLFHTVLMHVPDDELDGLIERIRAPVVYVSEMMGREWRRDGEPPVYNRDASEYATAFARHGFALNEATTEIYEHYGRPMGLLQFIRGD